MNQQQTKYTLSRVDAVESRKLLELKKEYTVPAKIITHEEAQQLILKKKVPLKAVSNTESFDSYSRLRDFFDFSKFHYGESFKDGYAEAVDALKSQANRVRDEIVLGDNAQALALLREFAGE